MSRGRAPRRADGGRAVPFASSSWVGPWRCDTCGDAVRRHHPRGPNCRCFAAEVLGIAFGVLAGLIPAAPGTMLAR